MEKTKKQKIAEETAPETDEETEQKAKERKKFIARAAAWAMFSCVLPVVFIGWRYDLFGKKASSLSLTGWGMFAIIIITVFVYVVVKYIRAGFPDWSMAKQIISGIIKVLLPIGAILALCAGIRVNMDYFIQALSCVLICEAIAIPINPFPEWVWNKSQGKFESAVDYIADAINNRNKEGQ